MRHALSSAVVAVALLASAAASAATYTIEARHTQVVARWNHLGFSNPSAKIVGIEGTLEFDPAAPTKASVVATLPLAAMTTGVPDLDDDFRSPSFFDFPTFPVATFTSTRVTRGAAPNRLVVVGDLALHGVTKPVALDVTINKVGTNPRNKLASVGFEATGTLKRSDFGVGRFVPQVSDEVRLELTVEAADAEGAARLRKAEEAEEAAEAAKKAANG